MRTLCLGLLGVTLVASAPALAGPQCDALGASQYMASGSKLRFDTSTAVNWNQKASVFLDANNVHTDQLCSPVSGANILAAMGSSSSPVVYGNNNVIVGPYLAINAGSPVGNAASSNESTVAKEEYLLASRMRTGNLDWVAQITGIDGLAGTLTMDNHGFFRDDLVASLGGYGAFSPYWYTSYSGFNPSNVSTDTFAEPMCQTLAQVLNGTESGVQYDFGKTVFQLQLGFFDISEIDVPYPCWNNGPSICQAGTGIYTVIYVGGHFVSLTGVGSDSTTTSGQTYVHIIDSEGPGNTPATQSPNANNNWQVLGWETFKIGLPDPGPNFTLFDHAGSVWLAAGIEGNHALILGYNQVTVTHGGDCGTNSALYKSGSNQGFCGHAGCTPPAQWLNGTCCAGAFVTSGGQCCPSPGLVDGNGYCCPNGSWLVSVPAGGSYGLFKGQSCCAPPAQSYVNNGTWTCCEPPKQLINGVCQLPCCANTSIYSPSTCVTDNVTTTIDPPNPVTTLTCKDGRVPTVIHDPAPASCDYSNESPAPVCGLSCVQPVTWGCACPANTFWDSLRSVCQRDCLPGQMWLEGLGKCVKAVVTCTGTQCI
jgi:hypothetical protein